MKNNIEYFDLGPEIIWTGENLDLLKDFAAKITAQPLANSYGFAGLNLLPLSKEELLGLISLFPTVARDRSFLRNITASPAIWVSSGTGASDITTTKDITNALSPTYLLPGYTASPIWSVDDHQNEIILFDLAGVDKAVARIILAKSLIHEFAHTIVNQLWYVQGYALMISGQRQAGRDILTRFATLAREHTAISYYAEAYAPLPTFLDSANIMMVIEELCECIAAYIMGYSYCADYQRCLDPFGDRPEILAFVIDFLNATIA